MKLSKVILFLAVSLAMGINVIVNQAGVYVLFFVNLCLS